VSISSINDGGENSLEIVTQPLFPSFVWTTLFDDRESFNVKMLDLANRMRISDSAGVSKTNVKGWQSPNILQNLKEFEEMNLRILQVCRSIAESQNFNSNLIYRHQAWVNLSPPGASNKIHYHANCHFSGVYYISLQAPECGSIYFLDPRVASRMLSYPADKETEFTASHARMRPEEGRMYVFPGWLEHGVEVNQSDRDRVSISFNVLALPRPPDSSSTTGKASTSGWQTWPIR
jgi:uncharacterized protein (TIGR02466 family)